MILAGSFQQNQLFMHILPVARPDKFFSGMIKRLFSDIKNTGIGRYILSDTNKISRFLRIGIFFCFLPKTDQLWSDGF